MFFGLSIEHVNQGIGKCYSKNQIQGYYNDLTNKVLYDKALVNNLKIPLYILENGNEIEFSIQIFQYGLGSYDLFLLTKLDIYKNKFFTCVEWAIKNQNSNGSWDTFSFKLPEHPYSSMAQGEGASLLLRAYVLTNDQKYILSAEKALNFLIKSIEKGGTTSYVNNEIFLKEFTNSDVILNGWIFSLFGLYDYLLIKNNNTFREVYNKSLATLVNHLSDFDLKFWSKYNSLNTISSPFYHKLHISLLDALYNLTGIGDFLKLKLKWESDNKNFVYYIFALFLKIKQKYSEVN